MKAVEYGILALSSLIVIVDPIAVVPAFLAMTPNDSPLQRRQMAKIACWVMTGVLIVFALSGPLLFRFLGITLPAFQIAGSILLLLISLDMLRGQRSRAQVTLEETEAGAEKADIAVTPLAIPMLSGPGAISTVVLLRNQAAGAVQLGILCGCVVVTSIATYFTLRFSSRGAQWLNPIALRITTRIMGLLLAAVAIQFMINALRELKVIPAL